MIQEDYLIFTPGPVKMSQEILEIGAKQTPYFRNQEFSDVLLECETSLLKMLNAPHGSRIVFLTASGTAGMEATVMNLLTQDDCALIVNGGGFGQRFVDISKSYSIRHKEVKPYNTNLANIEDTISANDCNTFIVNAHETSIGLLYDLDAIGKFCAKYDLLNIVDAISMFVTDPLDMQTQNIDVAIISSQKGLALPPGLTMVALTPKAINKLQPIKSHYFNFKNYLRDGERGQTPYTPAVSIILQLQARLKQIEYLGGIQATNEKSKEIAQYFREQLAQFPLEFYTKFMPNAMTALVPKDSFKAKEIVAIVEDKYKIVLCPNGGDLADKVFRVSHMGEITTSDINLLLSALKKLYQNN
jgi:aspartate aminotransferase-like enzyme